MRTKPLIEVQRKANLVAPGINLRFKLDQIEPPRCAGLCGKTTWVEFYLHRIADYFGFIIAHVSGKLATRLLCSEFLGFDPETFCDLEHGLLSDADFIGKFNY